MEQLARLRSRIGNLRELRNVIYAMRGLAVARVQQAQGALAGTRAYSRTIEAAIGRAATLLGGHGGSRHVPEPAWSDGSAVAVVLCSEHGFVGGYNEKLIERLRDSASAGREIGIVGRRGARLAREMGLDPAWELAMASQISGISAVARRIAARLDSPDTVSIIGANYRSAGQVEITETTVLPLDPRLLKGGSAGSPPLHHLEPVRLLARLGSEYVLAEILHALMEAMASENVERLSVMRAAEDTIDDRLEKLGARERVLRQEEITSELLDIVTGAEAAGLNG